MRSVDQSHLPLESELDSPGESELGLRVIVEKAKSRQLSSIGQSGARQRGQIWSSGSIGFFFFFFFFFCCCYYCYGFCWSYNIIALPFTFIGFPFAPILFIPHMPHLRLHEATCYY